jgi:hypothetical protein
MTYVLIILAAVLGVAIGFYAGVHIVAHFQVMGVKKGKMFIYINDHWVLEKTPPLSITTDFGKLIDLMSSDAYADTYLKDE